MKEKKMILGAGMTGLAAGVASGLPVFDSCLQDSDFGLVLFLFCLFESLFQLSDLISEGIVPACFSQAEDLGGDGVWRIDLATLTVDGPMIATGRMGSLGSGQYPSSMIIDGTGSTIATCNTLDDNISIIDVDSWSESARIAVGDSPCDAAFSCCRPAGVRHNKPHPVDCERRSAAEELLCPPTKAASSEPPSRLRR